MQGVDDSSETLHINTFTASVIASTIDSITFIAPTYFQLFVNR